MMFGPSPWTESTTFCSTNCVETHAHRTMRWRPQQGSRRPWQVYQNYLRDMLTIRFGRIADGVLRFGARGALP